ncbi:phage late control D family protein [Clostridium saccharoperbutylacetonicum]
MVYISDDYSKFQEKYNNFMLPSYQISIDGTTFTLKDFNITNININLSVKEKAGTANFSVSNCYSLSDKGFDKKIKSLFKLGSIVKISLGYSDTNEDLFLGYIDSIAYEFGDIPQINVNCLDAMALLMKNKVEERTLPEKSPKEIITDIFNNYSSFIKDSKIDELQPIDSQIVRNEDDYTFISAIAKENNYDFFVVGEKVYLSDLKSSKDVIVTLLYGINVLRFSREFRLKKIEVTAYGKDDKQNETVSESCTSKTDYPYINSLDEVMEKKVIRSPRIDSSDKAKKIALNEAKELIEESYSSNIECIGLPELIPGKFVTIKNFDSDIDGTFYITDTNHSFSPGHYTVSLNISNS